MNQKVLDELPRFRDRAQALLDKHHGASKAPQLEVNVLRKNIRIERVGVASWGENRGVFCFIDAQTGDVLFAGSWSRPTKSSPIRGNIFAEEDEGLGIVGGCVRYLR